MVSIKCCCYIKKTLFVWFNATAESVNCSLFLENLEKDFCCLTYMKKTFVKHIEKLLQHFSKKFIGDNLWITNVSLRNCNLSVLHCSAVQSVFRIIGYIIIIALVATERFIVPIAVDMSYCIV